MGVGSLIKDPIATGAVPITDLKAHLRVTHGEDDLEIASMGKAALEFIETATRRIISSRTVTWRLPCFPSAAWNDSYRSVVYCSPNAAMVLPVIPVSSVTSINYVDDNGDSQLLDAADYQVVIDDNQGYIVPAYNTTWPDTRSVEIAVTIVMVAGYATIPAAAQHAIRLLVGHWYEHREAVGTVGKSIELSCNALLETLKSNYTVAI